MRRLMPPGHVRNNKSNAGKHTKPEIRISKRKSENFLATYCLPQQVGNGFFLLVPVVVLEQGAGITKIDLI